MTKIKCQARTVQLMVGGRVEREMKKLAFSHSGDLYNRCAML